MGNPSIEVYAPFVLKLCLGIFTKDLVSCVYEQNSSTKAIFQLQAVCFGVLKELLVDLRMAFVENVASVSKFISELVQVLGTLSIESIFSKEPTIITKTDYSFLICVETFNVMTAFVVEIFRYGQVCLDSFQYLRSNLNIATHQHEKSEKQAVQAYAKFAQNLSSTMNSGYLATVLQEIIAAMKQQPEWESVACGIFDVLVFLSYLVAVPDVTEPTLLTYLKLVDTGIHEEKSLFIIWSIARNPLSRKPFSKIHTIASLLRILRQGSKTPTNILFYIRTLHLLFEEDRYSFFENQGLQVILSILEKYNDGGISSCIMQFLRVLAPHHDESQVLLAAWNCVTKSQFDETRCHAASLITRSKMPHDASEKAVLAIIKTFFKSERKMLIRFACRLLTQVRFSAQGYARLFKMNLATKVLRYAIDSFQCIEMGPCQDCCPTNHVWLEFKKKCRFCETQTDMVDSLMAMYHLSNSPLFQQQFCEKGFLTLLHFAWTLQSDHQVKIVCATLDNLASNSGNRDRIYQAELEIENFKQSLNKVTQGTKATRIVEVETKKDTKQKYLDWFQGIVQIEISKLQDKRPQSEMISFLNKASIKSPMKCICEPKACLWYGSINRFIDPWDLAVESVVEKPTGIQVKLLNQFPKLPYNFTNNRDSISATPQVALFPHVKGSRLLDSLPTPHFDTIDGSKSVYIYGIKEMVPPVLSSEIEDHMFGKPSEPNLIVCIRMCFLNFLDMNNHQRDIEVTDFIDSDLLPKPKAPQQPSSIEETYDEYLERHVVLPLIIRPAESLFKKIPKLLQMSRRGYRRGSTRRAPSESVFKPRISEGISGYECESCTPKVGNVAFEFDWSTCMQKKSFASFFASVVSRDSADVGNAFQSVKLTEESLISFYQSHYHFLCKIFRFYSSYTLGKTIVSSKNADNSCQYFEGMDTEMTLRFIKDLGISKDKSISTWGVKALCASIYSRGIAKKDLTRAQRQMERNCKVYSYEQHGVFNRFDFLEFIFKLVHSMYPAKTPLAVASKNFFDRYIIPLVGKESNLNGDIYRSTRLCGIPLINELLNSKMPVLEVLFTKFAGSTENCSMWGGRENSLMTFFEWIQFLEYAGLFSPFFTELEAAVIFKQSIYEVDDIPMCWEKSIALTMTGFLEAVSRVADAVCIPSVKQSLILGFSDPILLHRYMSKHQLWSRFNNEDFLLSGIRNFTGLSRWTSNKSRVMDSGSCETALSIKLKPLLQILESYQELDTENTLEQKFWSKYHPQKCVENWNVSSTFEVCLAAQLHEDWRKTIKKSFDHPPHLRGPAVIASLAFSELAELEQVEYVFSVRDISQCIRNLYHACCEDSNEPFVLSRDMLLDEAHKNSFGFSHMRNSDPIRKTLFQTATPLVDLVADSAVALLKRIMK